MLKDNRLPCRPVSAEKFRPYGDLIEPTGDGLPFGPDDAELDLGRGRPRLYIMTLKARGLTFTDITRHRLVTQCLAAMGGVEWLLAVAPPGDPEDPALRPDPNEIAAFRISGTAAVKLHRGTWHAGPYFTAPQVDFLNLELTDTNQIDHDTCDLGSAFGVRMTLVP